MTRTVPLAFALALAACSPEPVPVAEPKAAPEVVPLAPVAKASPAASLLAIEGEGLRLFNADTGAARPIPFGTAREQALASLTFRGRPAFARLEECGAGPIDQAAWPDGLALHFQDGKFAGWALDGRSAGKLTTASGIGPGSTRAELEEAYSAKVTQSTLGTEFTAGDLAGLLDGTGSRARITNLWAGVSCNYR